jgi:hypothetical protein
MAKFAMFSESAQTGQASAYDDNHALIVAGGATAFSAWT